MICCKTKIPDMQDSNKSSFLRSTNVGLFDHLPILFVCLFVLADSQIYRYNFMTPTNCLDFGVKLLTVSTFSCTRPVKLFHSIKFWTRFGETEALNHPRCWQQNYFYLSWNYPHSSRLHVGT